MLRHVSAAVAAAGLAFAASSAHAQLALPAGDSEAGRAFALGQRVGPRIADAVQR